MPTLKDFKEQRGLTNKQVGLALGCSASVASMVLQGRHIHVYTDEQIAKQAEEAMRNMLILPMTKREPFDTKQPYRVGLEEKPSPEWHGWSIEELRKILGIDK